MNKFVLVYNNFDKDLKNKLYDKFENSSIEFEFFNEDIYKEKKKAWRIKNQYGTKMVPFAVLYGEDKKVIKAFYTDNKECTLDNINNVLNTLNQ